MNFLEYANMHQCNIIQQDGFEQLTTEVFNVISENICRSLGPLGSSATILDGTMTEATKDGYSILSHYRFNNRYKRMILNLIKTPCTKMNNTVGDGTTTVIALTNALFKRYRSIENRLQPLYHLPRQLTKTWDDVTNEIVSLIQKEATPLDPEDYERVYNLAYVVSNGNVDISTEIAKVYQQSKTPAIKLKDSPTNKSYIEAVNGFAFPTNAIDSVYVNNEDLSTTETNVMTMIFAQKLTKDIMENVIVPVGQVAHAMKRKLIIIAPSYDDYMCETSLGQLAAAEMRQWGNVNTLMTQYRLSDTENGQRDDLAVVLRSKVITQLTIKDIIAAIHASPDKFVHDAMNDPESPLYHMIGFADTAFISCKNGSIFTVDGIEEDAEYQQALTRAMNELDAVTAKYSNERQSYSHQIYDARARVLQLQMKNYIYYVGANSDLQKQILWDAIEDVVKCMRSAIRCGVIPGCQLTIMKICSVMQYRILYKNGEQVDANSLSKEEKLKLEIIRMIQASCQDVYAMVLHGPDGYGIVKMFDGWDTTDEESCKEYAQKAIDKGYEIIKQSIEKNEVFDLEKMDFNPNIITSAETDEMVLKAAGELIKILISGNQCIFIDSEVNESHQETRDVYV